MTEDDWSVSFAKSLGVFLNGSDLSTAGSAEHPTDDNFYLVLNAYWEQMLFVLPGPEFGSCWVRVLDTARLEDPFCDELPDRLDPGEKLAVEGRSVLLLRSC